MKIEELKSARMITDPAEIATLLEAAVKEAGPKASHQVSKTKDGIAVVHKTITGKMAPTMPSVDEIRSAATAVGLPWIDEYADRAIAYWASDERVDGHGDIVRQNWIFDSYAKNPVLQYSHDWTSPPIGNVVKWQIAQRAETDYTGPALWLLSLFATKDQSDFADSIFRLVKARILRGCSVGFMPKTVVDVKDDAERQALGLGRWGYVLDNNELIELSPTPIGANAGALSILTSAKRAKLLQPTDVQILRDLKRRECRSLGRQDTWGVEDKEMIAMAHLLFPKAEFSPANDIDEPLLGNEPGALKGMVTIKSEDEMDIGARLDAIEAMLQDALVSQQTQLDDIRTMLEAITTKLEINATGADPDEADDGEEEPDDVGKQREVNLATKIERARSFLR